MNESNNENVNSEENEENEIIYKLLQKNVIQTGYLFIENKRLIICKECKKLNIKAKYHKTYDNSICYFCQKKLRYNNKRNKNNENMEKDKKARKIIKRLIFRCRCGEEISLVETKFHYPKCYPLEFNQIKQRTNNSQITIANKNDKEKELNENDKKATIGNENDKEKKLNENNKKKTIANKNNEKITIANKNDKEKELNENDKKTTTGNENDEKKELNENNEKTTIANKNNEKRNPFRKTKLNIIGESNVGSNGETNRHLNERSDGGVEEEANGVNSLKIKKGEKKENSGTINKTFCCCANCICCICDNNCCMQENSCKCKNCILCLWKSQNENREENNCIEYLLLILTTLKSIIGISFSGWIMAKVPLIINEESIKTKINLHVNISELNILASFIAFIIGYIVFFQCKNKKIAAVGAIITNIPDFILGDITTTYFMFKQANEIINYLINDDSNQKISQIIQDVYIKLVEIYWIIFAIKIVLLSGVVISSIILCCSYNNDQQNINAN